MMKILVVEDDRHLNKAICDMLKSLAETTLIYDGEEALFHAQQNFYDLIILDIMLPNVDGFTILEKIRTTSKCPVLMLTAKDGVKDKVKGLNLGADDYMTKPFYRDELIARVEAILRRYNDNFKGLNVTFKDMKSVEAILRRYNDNFKGLNVTFKDMKFDIVQKKVTIKDENLNITG